jgi:hypothetical protein
VSVRSIVSALALAMTGYLAARGLWWTGPVEHPWIIFAALTLYLLVTWFWIFWGSPVLRRMRGAEPVSLAAASGARRSRLPLWGAALAIAVAVIVPNAVMFAVPAEARDEPYAAWVIGGVGALMTIVMVRRRPWTAWVGLAIAAVSVSLWMGPLTALSLGLIGDIVWVAVAQLMMLSLGRAARDTAELAELQQAASAWQAAQAGRQRERRLQVQRALQTAGPILGRTIETGGNLRPDEKLEARLAEGRLRDELRGPRLLDDAVRAELEAARRRGVAITMFDEGGLDGVSEADLGAIRSELAVILRDIASTRLIIRTSPDERVAVTVLGRSGDGGSLSDEDSVELWHEIPRRA